MMKVTIIPSKEISQQILVVRGKQVLLDHDLAHIYGVSIKRLNEQVKRNIDRFPIDFRFQVTPDEYHALRSHFATLKRGQHRKYLPYVFTEHGALQLASVLKSPIATQVSLSVVRAFVRLREMISSHKDIMIKIEDLERKSRKHDHYIGVIFENIRKLLLPPIEPPKKKIGFKREEESS
jgi:hypothetical protein